MKLSFKKVIFLILMIIGFLWGFSKASFGITQKVGDKKHPIVTAGPVYTEPDLYCRTHGVAFTPLASSGEPPTTLVYEGSEYTYRGPFGYAVNVLGLRGKALQNAIWYTNVYGDDLVVDPTSKTSNAALRYQEYYMVYENIIKKLEKGDQLFEIEPQNSDDISVCVDQTSGEYIVGPYTLSLNKTKFGKLYSDKTDDETNNEAYYKALAHYFYGVLDQQIKLYMGEVYVKGPDGKTKTLSALVDAQDVSKMIKEDTTEDGQVVHKISYKYDGKDPVVGLLTLIKIMSDYSCILEESATKTIIFKDYTNSLVDPKEKEEVKNLSSFVARLIDLYNAIESSSKYSFDDSVSGSITGKQFYNLLEKLISKSKTYSILYKLYYGEFNNIKLDFEAKDSNVDNGVYLEQKNNNICFYMSAFKIGDNNDTFNYKDVKAAIDKIKENAKKALKIAAKILYQEICGSINFINQEHLGNIGGKIIPLEGNIEENKVNGLRGKEGKTDENKFSTDDGFTEDDVEVLNGSVSGKNNQLDENTFARYMGVTGISATTKKIKISDGKQPIVIDQFPNIQFLNIDGTVITFPDFTTNKNNANQFYIKYTPDQSKIGGKNTNGVNVETGKPILNIMLLKDTGTVQESKYELTKAIWTDVPAEIKFEIVEGSIVGIPPKQKIFYHVPTRKEAPESFVINAVVRYTFITDMGNFEKEYNIHKEIKFKRNISHITKPDPNNPNEISEYWKVEYSDTSEKKIREKIEEDNATLKNPWDGNTFETDEKVVVHEKKDFQTVSRYLTGKIDIPEEDIDIDYDLRLYGTWLNFKNTLIGKEINVKIGGRVWEEGKDTKTNDIASPGRMQLTNKGGDQAFAGIEVWLYESQKIYKNDSNLTEDKQFIVKAKTKTNSEGRYEFNHLNPLKKYFVRFFYNGMLYEPTYYTYNLQNREKLLNEAERDFSNADEYDSYRTTLNNRFGEINSTTSGNYTRPDGTKNTAYGLNTVLRTTSGGVTKKNGADLTFGIAWNEYLRLLADQNAKLYKDDLLKTENSSPFFKYLNDSSVENIAGIMNFIQDCMISSFTFVDSHVKKTTSSYNEFDNIGNLEKITYPVYDKFVARELNVDNQSSGTKTDDGSAITFKKYKGGADANFMELYTKNSDQSRFVSFGLRKRVNTDITLQKDLYKVSLIVNGKLEEYKYSKKNLDDDGYYKIEIQNSGDLKGLYDGSIVYNRSVRPSDIMYATQTNTGEQSRKRDLQAYVTYRIGVKNLGQTTIGSNLEIVDYYDVDQFTFDGVLKNDGSYDIEKRKVALTDGKVSYQVSNKEYFTSYSTVTNNLEPDNKETNPNLVIKTKSSTGEDRKLNANNGKFNYESLYLTGFNKTLTPGDAFAVYITFKVNLNNVSGKIKLDENLSTNGSTAAIDAVDVYKVGKRNIAEIYKYSSYYNINETKLLDYLQPVYDSKATINPVSFTKVDKTITNWTHVGIVDVNSKPGSLTNRDIYGSRSSDNDVSKYGRLIKEYKENDEDQSPNLKFTIQNTPESSSIRSIEGMTYEDWRNIGKDNGGVVGDGKYKQGEDTIINGVTVELVELVTGVDSDGISNGTYIAEHTWGRYYFDKIEVQGIDGGDTLVAIVPAEISQRYSSGENKARIVINGPQGTKLHVDENGSFLKKGNGEYGFYSMAAGDYFIRFHYGDEWDTILTNDPKNEVYQLLKDTDLAAKGKNIKSYNGQDYKSTVYQSVIDQSALKKHYPGSVDNGTGQNIDGFVRYGDKQNEIAQNYRNSANDTDNEMPNFNANTQKMYVYDINASENAGVSDAKDVYKYRERSLGYSQVLKNYNSEVLASFEKIVTTDYPIWYKYYGKDKNGNEVKLLSGDGMTSEYINYVEDARGNLLKDKITRTELFLLDISNKEKQDLIDKQKSLLKQLMRETAQTAQSGVIDLNVEKNKSSTDVYKENSLEENNTIYKLTGVDLGISERPQAQLLLNKEVEKVTFTLTNGSILFQAQGPASDLIYTKHNQHGAKLVNGKLVSVKRTVNKKALPEIIQGYIDEEILNGGNLKIDYKFTVTNVGEVDYQGNEYYYKGTGATSQTVSRTRADLVVDYISTELRYNEQSQPEEDKGTWKSKSKDELIPSVKAHPGEIQRDLVNAVYYNELESYGNNNYSYMVTDKMAYNGTELGLLPKSYNKDKCTSNPVHMTLTASTSLYDANSSLTYNNLCEIIQITNNQGRRMQFSITGNQPMADQDTKNDAIAEENGKFYAKFQVATPSEVDADSAQQISFLPPTGENRNHTLGTFIAVAAATIVAVGYIIIRRALMVKKKSKI